MLAFLADLANLLTLAGLLCALLGIYFAILGIFPAAMIGMLWALLLDWIDGTVARRTPGRSRECRAVGAQLDSLVDIVSFGICPALVLLSYGEFSPWFLPGAFALVAACVVRLAYFNVFGLADGSTYVGLAADYNVVAVSLLFLVEGLVSERTFAVVLYAMIVALAIANVAPIRSPKLGGRWYHVMIVFVLGLTVANGLRLWTETP